MRLKLTVILLFIVVVFSGQIAAPPQSKAIPFYTFRIDGTIFDQHAMVIVSRDYERVSELVNRLIYANTKVNDFIINRGMVMVNEPYPPILWIQEKPKSIEEYSVLNHEIMHLVSVLLRHCNIKLTKDTEEVYAYMFQYYSKIIYIQLQ